MCQHEIDRCQMKLDLAVSKLQELVKDLEELHPYIGKEIEKTIELIIQIQ